MAIIKEITVKVEKSIPLDTNDFVIYSCSAKADVITECPIQVYEELLGFCQDKISKEVSRIERGEPAKIKTNIFNEDFVPSFKPFNK